MGIKGKPPPGKKWKRKPLAKRELEFCHFFMESNNITEACEKSGVSRASAYRWLREREDIKGYIETQRKKMADKFDITQERVLREEARIAFFDPRALFDESGDLKPMTELDYDVAAAVSSVEVTYRPNPERGEPPLKVTKIRLNNKGASLERVSKHLGLYSKDNEQKSSMFILDPENIKRPDNAGVSSDSDTDS